MARGFVRGRVVVALALSAVLVFPGAGVLQVAAARRRVRCSQRKDRYLKLSIDRKKW